MRRYKVLSHVFLHLLRWSCSLWTFVFYPYGMLIASQFLLGWCNSSWKSSSSVLLVLGEGVCVLWSGVYGLQFSSFSFLRCLSGFGLKGTLASESELESVLSSFTFLGEFVKICIFILKCLVEFAYKSFVLSLSLWLFFKIANSFSCYRSMLHRLSFLESALVICLFVQII